MEAPKTNSASSKWPVAALCMGVLAIALLVGTIDWRSAEAPATDAPEIAEEPRSPRVARIQLVIAPVEIGRPESDSWRDAKEGDSLAPGETLRTGWGGRAEIELSGNQIRLFENSAFRLPTKDSSSVQAVHLDRGSSLFEVKRRQGARHFEVHTPEAVAAVRGTRFGVTAEGEQVELIVFEGSVAIWSEEQPEVLVRPGFGAIGTGETPFQITVVDESDPWNTWSQPTASIPRIDLGSSLSDSATGALKSELKANPWPLPAAGLTAQAERSTPIETPVRAAPAKNDAPDSAPRTAPRAADSPRAGVPSKSVRNPHREEKTYKRSDFDDARKDDSDFREERANFDDDAHGDDTDFSDERANFDDDAHGDDTDFSDEPANFDDDSSGFEDDSSGFEDDSSGFEDDGFDDGSGNKSKKSKKSKR